jgi:hypothetical protein
MPGHFQGNAAPPTVVNLIGRIITDYVATVDVRKESWHKYHRLDRAYSEKATHPPLTMAALAAAVWART